MLAVQTTPTQLPLTGSHSWYRMPVNADEQLNRLSGMAPRIARIVIRQTHGWNKTEDYISSSQWDEGLHCPCSSRFRTGLLEAIQLGLIGYRRACATCGTSLADQDYCPSCRRRRERRGIRSLYRIGPALLPHFQAIAPKTQEDSWWSDDEPSEPDWSETGAALQGIIDPSAGTKKSPESHSAIRNPNGTCKEIMRYGGQRSLSQGYVKLQGINDPSDTYCPGSVQVLSENHRVPSWVDDPSAGGAPTPSEGSMTPYNMSCKEESIIANPGNGPAGRAPASPPPEPDSPVDEDVVMEVTPVPQQTRIPEDSEGQPIHTPNGAQGSEGADLEHVPAPVAIGRPEPEMLTEAPKLDIRNRQPLLVRIEQALREAAEGKKDQRDVTTRRMAVLQGVIQLIYGTGAPTWERPGDKQWIKWKKAVSVTGGFTSLVKKMLSYAWLDPANELDLAGKFIAMGTKKESRDNRASLYNGSIQSGKVLTEDEWYNIPGQIYTEAGLRQLEERRRERGELPS